MTEQQASQLQALSAQVVSLKWDASSQQHTARELAAARELCEAQAAQLESARRQLQHQVLPWLQRSSCPGSPVLSA